MSIIKNGQFLLLTLCVLALTLGGCRKKENGAGPGAPAAETQPSTITLSSQAAQNIGLTVEAAVRKPVSRIITVSARVVPDQDREACVGSLVRGRVARVLVKVGERVKAGQPLMLVEGLEIGEIKAGFLLAKANLTYRKSALERQQKLLEENIGSQKSLLEAQNEYEKARAEYQAGRNRIAAIGVNEADIADDKDNPAFGSISVRSPISGVVIERSVVTGQLIEGNTDAFRIVDLGSVWVDGQLYEKDLGSLAAGNPVEFLSSSNPGEAFSGRISYVSPVIDEKSRTITVRAEFRNPNGKLKPQMFGEMKILSGSTAPAILVPAEAVAKMDNADFVFVQKDPLKFEKRAVTILPEREGVVAIDKGVQEGEHVVVTGAANLKAELLKSSFAEEE